jgi:hypothetical protein
MEAEKANILIRGEDIHSKHKMGRQMNRIDNSIKITAYDDKNNDRLMLIKGNFSKDVENMQITDEQQIVDKFKRQE